MTRPLAIDLFCGLGGWTEGLIVAGYRVVGFDIEQHVYGEHRYPAQLVLQDVLTIHGRQFKDAALIVASPPCQEYSYMAMPWSKAKQRLREYESGVRDVRDLTALFDACFRIQREACEASGRHIPLVVENVRGAQRWVGRSRWHFGSFHLWGDVPALMPIARGRMKGAVTHRPNDAPFLDFRCGQKVATDRICDCGHRESEHGINGFDANLPCSRCSCINPVWTRRTAIGNRFSTDCDGVKVATMGAGWYPPGHPKHQPGLAFNTHAERGLKGAGDGWFNDAKRKGGTATGRLSQSGSKSHARKAASAMIAKIPLTLSRHIASAWHPEATA